MHNNITHLTFSGVVVKIVLPRWQKGVRGRGAVLGYMVWATLRVLGSKIFRFLSPLIDAKSYVLWVAKAEGSSQFIYSDILRWVARI